MALVELSPSGLYCPQAGLHIDPWRPVNAALITHAHSDHARSGSRRYLAHEHCVPFLKARLGRIQAQGFSYGSAIAVNGVRISFHPAGHIPGSSQIRLEYRGEVWVVSGDYKTQADGISTPFEPVPCHVFITESTFGLPLYRWRPQQEVFDEINSWWASNAESETVSLIIAYSLGKAQRIIQGIDRNTGPVIVHPSVADMNDVMHSISSTFPSTIRWNASLSPADFRRALVIVPPGAADAAWIERMKPYSTAHVSGWMQLRGARRWQGVDRGFVLSDHADWPGLVSAVKATGAEKVYVTHGYSDIFSRWLTEQGHEAHVLETLFEGEQRDVVEKNNR